MKNYFGFTPMFVKFMSFLLIFASFATAQTTRMPEVVRKLGASVPLDRHFVDEQGREVILRDLVDKPTVLTLVYYGCPNGCELVLNEVADTMVQSNLTPGTDYQVISISIDPTEKADWARSNKTHFRKLYAEAKGRELPPDAWRFLTTARTEEVRALADAVGFYYVRGADGLYTHPLTVIFLTREGKVVRYLNGREILPTDWKLAVTDATSGTARSFIQQVQRLCYSYNPQAQSYALKIDRIIMGVSLLFVGAFAVVLLVRRRKQPPASKAVLTQPVS